MTRPFAKRFGAASALTALVGSIAVVATALPAQAAWDNCPVRYACVWSGDNYMSSGRHTGYIKAEHGIPDLSTWLFSGTSTNGANNATSVVNRGTKLRAYLYANKKYGTLLFSLYPNGERDPNLGNGIDTRAEVPKPASVVNNNIESFRFEG